MSETTEKPAYAKPLPDMRPEGDTSRPCTPSLPAMGEIGADTRQYGRFAELVGKGIDPVDAMRTVGAPEHVCAFVAHTLRVAIQEPTLNVMTNFFHGRENVIPQMFGALLSRWHVDEADAPMFVFYLKRHIEVDGESHGPMAQQIIDRAIDGDEGRQAMVIRAAIESVRARIALWDGVAAELARLKAA